jgi:hypothetical protein
MGQIAFIIHPTTPLPPSRPRASRAKEAGTVAGTNIELEKLR